MNNNRCFNIIAILGHCLSTWKIFPLSLALFLFLFLAACGTTSTSSVAPDSSEQVKEMTLEEAAKAEGGELMVYMSTNIQDLEYILDKFVETYPFMKTDYYRASGNIVAQKLITEAQAGQHFADVIEIEAFEIFRLIEAGSIQSYVAPESLNYPSDAKDAEGLWTADRINTLVIGYNTELVSPDEVPRRLGRFTRPKMERIGRG